MKNTNNDAAEVISGSPKSLQKLTELRACKTFAEYFDCVNAMYPKPPGDETTTQNKARMELIVQALLENPFSTEEQKQDLRNQRWEANHQELVRAISNHVKENHRMPTVNDLSKETGLSRQTVNKHLRSFHLSEEYGQQLQEFRMMSVQVVSQLFRLSMMGDTKAARIFLDAVGGLAGVDSPSAASKQTNYLQVNNNIRIDQITFTSLPETVQQQITGLVLQGLNAQLIPEHTPEDASISESLTSN